MKRRFRITLEGKTYDVEVEEIGRETGREGSSGIPSRASPAASAVSVHGSETGEVFAPAPGKVLSVSVRPGDFVKAGDELLLLESMKIETRIEAHISGRVSEVKVSPGDTVKTRDLMVVIQQG